MADDEVEAGDSLSKTDKSRVSQAYLKLRDAINLARMDYEKDTGRKLQHIAITYNLDGSQRDKKIMVYKKK